MSMRPSLCVASKHSFFVVHISIIFGFVGLLRWFCLVHSSSAECLPPILFFVVCLLWAFFLLLYSPLAICVSSLFASVNLPSFFLRLWWWWCSLRSLFVVLGGALLQNVVLQVCRCRFFSFVFRFSFCLLPFWNDAAVSLASALLYEVFNLSYSF